MAHQSNISIPAQFSFQPFTAEWRYASAEILEWVEKPKLMAILFKPSDDPEKNWLRVRIGASPYGGLDGLYGIDYSPCHTVHMDRASIPPDVLLAHENHRNTPDVSGRWFTVLICQKPEFKDGYWVLKPGEVTKNAWIMRDEFLSLEADPDPVLGWDWSARQFLNKWGIWESGRGFTEDWSSRPIRLMPPSATLPEQKIDKPDFVLVIPHLLKGQQERYRKALLPSNARPWLRSHPLNLDTADEFPFFRVRRSYCTDAINATITIDHLADVQFGICKRNDCRKLFERVTEQKRFYCSPECAHLANVRKLRAQKKKLESKGRKNATRKN